MGSGAVLAVAVVLAIALAAGYAAASLRARRRGDDRAAVLEEQVGLLQQALLPPVPEVVGAVRTSVAYRPSEGLGAGGDFYDALELPGDRAAFILGDVCGHGQQAVAQTAFMRFTLRAYLEAGMEPRQALQVAGPVISHHLDGSFATAVIAVHDPASSTLTYACAGHPPPLVVGPERPDAVLAASSPPIGLDLRTGLRQTIQPLRPGAVICLYTDGLAEARKATRILGRPRIGDFVEELGPTAPARELLERVAEEARVVTDDMAAVLIRPAGATGEPGVRREQLEVDGDDVAGGIAEQFLAACRVAEGERAWIAEEAGRLTREHGTAIVDVTLAGPQPIASVLPGNVTSIGGAGRAPAVRHWAPPSLRRAGESA